MHFQIIHTPIGGIDTDSHDTMIDSVDYRNALNLRNLTTYIGKKSVRANVKGNTLISYSLSGKHKCIGTYEDKKENSLIYFLWSKNNEHKILRYYPTKVSNTNPYGVIEEIMVYNFRWNEMTKITSVDLVDGKLLYWVDPRPRKINVERANLTNKKKSWKIYFPKNFTSTLGAVVTCHIDVQYRNGILVNTQNFDINPNESIDSILSRLTTAINTAPTSTKMTAVYCDNCSVEVECKNVDDLIITVYGSTSNAPFYVVPDNWYGNNLTGSNMTDRMFDRIKYPPIFQPLVTHQIDADKNFNFVKNKVFQFRTQYHYTDNENSKLSPISQISINNTGDDTIEKQYNKIVIDCNNTDILGNTNELNTIKGISFLFREGNNGLWKRIKQFDICEVLDYDTEVKFIYNFYNNDSSEAISDILSSAQYDKVPIEAQASNYVNGRIVDANVTDNYDIDRCVDITSEITIDDAAQMEMVTLYGHIKIMSYRMNDSSFSGQDYPFYGYPYIGQQGGKLRGLITHDTSNSINYPTFGGAMFGYQPAWDFGITPDIAGKWGQQLPEGGFAVYSAGTDFLSISKQVVGGGLTITDKGGIDITSQSQIKQIGAYFSNVNNDCYSVFSMTVPKALHVIRIASHLCSFDDKLGLGDCYNLSNKSYQKTSTYVNGHFDTNAVWQEGKKEIVVDATAMSGTNFIGTFVIQDLCPSYDELPETDFTEPSILKDNPDYFYSWKNLVGYLYDDNGSINPNDAGYDGIPVSGAYIKGTVFDNRFPNNWFYSERLDSITDHNGFFFLTTMRLDDDADGSGIYLSAFQVNVVTGGGGVNLGLFGSGAVNAAAYATIDTFPFFGAATTIHGFAQNKYAGYLSNYFNKTLTQTLYSWDAFALEPIIFNELQNSGTTNLVISTDTATARTNCSVAVSGDVKDSLGVGVEGISVIATGGSVTKTIAGGTYSLVVWGNMYYSVTVDTTSKAGTFSTPQLDYFAIYAQNNDRNFDVVYQKGIISSGSFSVASSSHSVTFPSAPITGLTTVLDLIASYNVKSLKRGGNYSYGIRYYDFANRSSDVITDSSFYIPFITEDLNKYLPNYAVPNTYKSGIPTVVLTINHTAPSWAVAYQILLTENLNQLDYLQFKVNEVKYIIQSGGNGQVEIITNELNSNVTQLKVSLENINTYYRKNNDSVVGWTFNKGDKIRLITNEDGIYYQGLKEFEVVSFESPNWYIIKSDGTDIKTGSLIEIFSQKINQSAQIFYEVGECHKIIGGTHDGSPLTLSCGDTYWRRRTIPVLNDTLNIFNNYPCVVESNTISDFYQSKDSDIGRIGIEDILYKRIIREDVVRVSNNYIQGSNINGLNENDNVDDIHLGNGAIIKMEQVGDTILAICQNKAVSMYLGKVLARTVDSGIMTTTNEFIGDYRPLVGDFGTQHAESVKRFGNAVFIWDAYRGLVWKYDNNGIDDLSMKKNRAYFDNFGDIWECPAVYDSTYNEYVLTLASSKSVEVSSINNTIVGTLLTFPNIASFANLNFGDILLLTYNLNQQKKQVYGYVTLKAGTIQAELLEDLGVLVSDITIKFRDTAETIAYSNDFREWITKYSYTPEWYGNAKKELLSFVDGNLWIHDKNALYNNFYGTQYKSSLTFVVNGLKAGYGAMVKLWLAIAVRGLQSNKLFNWDFPTIKNNTQLSRLFKGAFVKKEEYWHKEFKRDINSIGGIENGKNLRSQTLEITMENDATTEVNINQIEIIATNSEKNT